MRFLGPAKIHAGPDSYPVMSTLITVWIHLIVISPSSNLKRLAHVKLADRSFRLGLPDRYDLPSEEEISYAPRYNKYRKQRNDIVPELLAV